MSTQQIHHIFPKAPGCGCAQVYAGSEASRLEFHGSRSGAGDHIKWSSEYREEGGLGPKGIFFIVRPFCWLLVKTVSILLYL